jgi:NhaA family Na+:H+ antiporter
MTTAVESAPPPGVRQIRLVRPVQDFIRTETSGGIILLIGAVIALVWVNSPWSDAYHRLFEHHLAFNVGFYAVDQPLHFWINDAAMVIFFFVVGMEIKRELVKGELKGIDRAALPAIAAVGGMVLPAAIFFAINVGGDGEHGWGIPMATDIAFALGLLAVLGRRISVQLRVFILALAIVDDIGAILVIAFFYSGDIQADSLLIAFALFAIVFAMNQARITALAPYFLVGAFCWIAVYESGIHATIAGVVLGLMTPANPYYTRGLFQETMGNLFARFSGARNRQEEEEIVRQMDLLTEDSVAPLDRLEHMLHPFTSYLIVPLFAAANAGVSLNPGDVSDSITSAVSIGVALGLLIGKPVGIFTATWLAVRLGISKLPRGTSWSELAGAGMLGGVGFTVALFVNELAFDSESLVEQGKIGILAGSLFAAVLGTVALLLVAKPGPNGNGDASDYPEEEEQPATATSDP